eukprot:gb/GECH01013120.1/.p1 GENE.gb/GECH01013120.1/~~gb/GECH01013120.1/.p1  ORF type:complete len:149 (+),score=20.20 gb/GECH01013120.1/:1-447(+)
MLRSTGKASLVASKRIQKPTISFNKQNFSINSSIKPSFQYKSLPHTLKLSPFNNKRTQSFYRFNRRWASSQNDFSSDDNGRLFGEKKLAPGEKREWDSWELPWYLFMYGGLLLLVLGLMLKPDYSLSTWAREEAIRRREEREAQEQQQ